MTRSKLVYVAGSYRAPTAKRRWENVNKAIDMALQVALRTDYVPVIPHSMYDQLDGCLTDSWFLEATLDLMFRCDAVLILPGYKESQGTLGEIAAALYEGIPVYYSLEALIEAGA